MDNNHNNIQNNLKNDVQLMKITLRGLSTWAIG